MKYSWKFFVSPLAVSFIVACGAAGGDESDQEQMDPGAIEAKIETTAFEGQAQEADTASLDALQSGGTQSLAKSKTCTATCTVINLGTGFCPTTIGGTGTTTFLGGCTKACTRAREDAASKLPSGCIINNCDTTC